MKTSSGPATPSRRALPGWTRYAAPAGLCSLILALLAAGIAGMWNIDAFDRAITDQVPGLRSPMLTYVMLSISSFGDAGFLWLMGPVVILSLLLKRSWWAAGACSASFLTMMLAVRGIKAWVARPRPTVDLYGGVEAFSFPSGHTANAAMIYGALALLAAISFKGAPRIAVVSVLGLLAFLIAVSRVYLGAHWPSDTLAGLALAGAILAGLAWALQRPSHALPTPHSPLLALTFLALAGPLHAWLSLPAAQALYHVLD